MNTFCNEEDEEWKDIRRYFESIIVVEDTIYNLSSFLNVAEVFLKIFTQKDGNLFSRAEI